MDSSREQVFQDDIIRHLAASGWLVGQAEHYDRERALYPEDLLAFVQQTQPQQWEKYCKVYPKDPEGHLLNKVTTQLQKADPQSTQKELRTCGTLGVLRHDIKDRGVRFKLCQFKPDHDLNPETFSRYQANRLRVVPELVYSPYATEAHHEKTGTKAKAYRIDLVLFVNGIPVATLELKSEFKQAVQNAIKQYKSTRLPIDPTTRKPEPLLTFKRGALVHFAVSQYEVYMTTRLAGPDTLFLPFNKGSSDGGAGNDPPQDDKTYATAYLWQEILQPDNWLNILGRFVHLQIDAAEDWRGLWPRSTIKPARSAFTP